MVAPKMLSKATPGGDILCRLCAGRTFPASRRRFGNESFGSAAGRPVSPGRGERLGLGGTGSPERHDAVVPELQAIVRMTGDLQDEVAVAALVQHLALHGFADRQSAKDKRSR